MLPLEDNFTDVINKAMRGLSLSEEQVAQKAGLPTETVAAVRSGTADEAALRAIAPALDLKMDALLNLATNAYKPAFIEPPPGFAAFNTPFNDMTVNSYLVWDISSGKAAIFDSGADCTEMLATIQKANLTVTDIFLTHTHGDHVFDVERLLEKTKAPLHACELEPFAGAKLFAPGTNFSVGGLAISTRSTIGHSKGGTTYVIEGLGKPLAIVGDAIFAGSMGGGGVSYEKALSTNREEILTLAEETILCPGHGPLTTVREQKAHNPFFP